MIELPTKSELLSLSTLYVIKDLAPIITKFFNVFLGHLNLKEPVLILSSMEIRVVSYRESLTVSMPYSNSYGSYKVWNWGVLYFNSVPVLLLINDDSDKGPLMYLLEDPNVLRSILYVLSQEMEVVQDGFAYDRFDSTLNYRDCLEGLYILN